MLTQAARVVLTFMVTQSLIFSPTVFADGVLLLPSTDIAAPKIVQLPIYDPLGNLWTWVSGSGMADATGVYVTKGMAAADNVPGARDGSVGWIDMRGQLLLFGGSAGPNYDTGLLANLNDLWRFQP